MEHTFQSLKLIDLNIFPNLEVMLYIQKLSVLLLQSIIHPRKKALVYILISGFGRLVLSSNFNQNGADEWLIFLVIGLPDEIKP